MKILLLTSDYHISANIGMKSFLDHPDLKKHGIKIDGILLADQFRFNSDHLKKTVHYFKRGSTSFLITNILTNIWKQAKIFFARLFSFKDRQYYGIDELAKIHAIPFLRVPSINSAKAKEFISQKKPDLLVSCFLLEIINKNVLEMAKLGGINVHPALVQDHRGIFASFWALVKSWRRSGATVHFMTDKIDEGGVILQRHFFVYPSDTIHSINQKAANLGGKLLAKAVVRLKKGTARTYRLKRLGALFSVPASNETEKFYSKGRSLISLKDFFKL